MHTVNKAYTVLRQEGYVKLDRRKGRALIEYKFDGNCYKVWVGYEMIEDDEKPVLD
jgi:DNA-binding transcriptional regulator YhcF (GntR family)